MSEEWMTLGNSPRLLTCLRPKKVTENWLLFVSWPIPHCCDGNFLHQRRVGNTQAHSRQSLSSLLATEVLSRVVFKIKFALSKLLLNMHIMGLYYTTCVFDRKRKVKRFVSRYIKKLIQNYLNYLPLPPPVRYYTSQISLSQTVYTWIKCWNI